MDSSLLVKVLNPVSLEKTLKEKDLVVLVDVSGSMGWDAEGGGGFLGMFGKKSNQTRLEQAKELIKAHFEILKNYGGGKDLRLITFGAKTQEYLISDNNQLLDVLHNLQAGGGTPTANALELAFEKVGNEAIVVVYTDGEPNDKGAVINTIAKKAQQVDPDKFGILFAQIGNSEDATKFIEYLDDGLVGDIERYTGKAGLDIVGSMTAKKLATATIEQIVEEALKG